MRIKNIKYLAAITIGFQLLAACSDDFIDVKPTGTALEDNYYKNADEAYNGLVAAYDPLAWVSFADKTVALNAASDDFLAGGGSSTDVPEIQAWDDYKVTPVLGPQQAFWDRNYSGIFRANVIISKLPGIDMDESLKVRFMAEAKFLRAYYYFDLVRLFEAFPQPLAPIETSEIFNVEQKDQASAYKIIEDDLNAAIPDLPEQVVLSSSAGRATKGAAISLLGKAYLYQDKFTEAADQFKLVNGTPGQDGPFGNGLLDNFSDLFKVANEFNKESIFEISHNSTSKGNWGNEGAAEGNLTSIQTAPRNYVVNDADKAPSFVSGWGFNPVTMSLVNAFVKGGVYDPRYATTIVNLDSLSAKDIITYDKAGSNEATGYQLAKTMGREEDKTASTDVPFELNLPDNNYEIRLADTYLMEAEALVRGGGALNRAQALLDAVRTRVGLASVPATVDNIMAERRLELAGEGHRWFDLVRTGMAATVLGPLGYIEGRDDKLPIPLSEIQFDGSPLSQDPAY